MLAIRQAAWTLSWENPKVQLAAMQQRLTELQDTNQRFESRGFARRGGAS